MQVVFERHHPIILFIPSERLTQFKKTYFFRDFVHCKNKLCHQTFLNAQNQPDSQDEEMSVPSDLDSEDSAYDYDDYGEILLCSSLANEGYRYVACPWIKKNFAVVFNSSNS